MPSFSTAMATKPLLKRFSQIAAQEQILWIKAGIQVLQLQLVIVTETGGRIEMSKGHLTGFWKRSRKKIGRIENQPRDQTCWYIHPEVRKCLKPLIRGKRHPQLQSPWTFPEEKGRFLCLEEAKAAHDVQT